MILFPCVGIWNISPVWQVLFLQAVGQEGFAENQYLKWVIETSRKTDKKYGDLSTFNCLTRPQRVSYRLPECCSCQVYLQETLKNKNAECFIEYGNAVAKANFLNQKEDH